MLKSISELRFVILKLTCHDLGYNLKTEVLYDIYRLSLNNFVNIENFEFIKTIDSI